ncbi:FkbM family methyltransferase [Candidatus Saccharibacteria bacterium]|nr:FkbM family methyltransferase [Candidatus Saccharibacteria bacterium]MBI3337894.1 FkbM family methyltransferase [Candidatus Saccharibacteria bacterium]
MIDPKAITTYAQYNEDIILLALLHDTQKGFYVDVGANYSVIDSVTKLFYEKGWHGINIEPIKSLCEQLIKDRPKDITLQIGIGDKVYKEVFREYRDSSGHSTFNIHQKQQHDEIDDYIDYTVDVKPLKDIFIEHKVEHIHFLKIDVEGFEYQVIIGNNWNKFRPEVICIEANHVSKDWRPILTKNDYKLFLADGLNEYYVAKESWHRTEGFAERVIKLDYHALKQHQWQSWTEDSGLLTVLNNMAEAQKLEIDHLKHKTELLMQLSMMQQSWPRRLKRALYGLTVDWFKYKKSIKSKK